MKEENTGRAFTTEQMIAEFKDKPAPFKPGEKWAYNNSGYVLVGAVIEKVTGKPWHQALEERITGPLGLETIRYGVEEASMPNMAKGHKRGEKGPEPAQKIHMSVPHAAGALIGSVEDLASGTRRCTASRWCRPSFMPAWWRRPSSTTAPRIPTASASRTARCAGGRQSAMAAASSASSPTASISLRKIGDGNALTIKVGNTPVTALHATSATEFQVDGMDASVTFKLDKEAVTGLTFRQGAREFAAERLKDGS